MTENLKHLDIHPLLEAGLFVTGKSTHLDILAGRKTIGEIKGDVNFAGQKPTVPFLKRFTGYSSSCPKSYRALQRLWKKNVQWGAVGFISWIFTLCIIPNTEILLLRSTRY
jgi:hypothetical protein